MISADAVKRWFDVCKKFYNEINFYRFIEKVTNLAETNYNLGLYHFNNNMISDAILRFKMAKFFDPSVVKAYYYISRCYYERYNYLKSKIYIERYLESQDPSYTTEAEFTLNTINREENKIIEIPISIIKNFFNKIASRYNELFIINQTTTPQQETLTHIVNALNSTSQLFGNNVLDLGCGTGTIGKYLRSQKVANVIIGVDVSIQSLKIAKQLVVDEMKVYNKLEELNVNYFLQKFDIQMNSKFDIIVASNYITYNHNLDYFFRQNFALSKELGLLCVTFKCIDDHDKQLILRFEQFYYNSNYVIDVAKNNNWVVYSIHNTMFTTQEKGKIIIFNKFKD